MSDWFREWRGDLPMVCFLVALVGAMCLWPVAAGFVGCGCFPPANSVGADLYRLGARARGGPSPTPTMAPFGPISFNVGGRTIREGLYYVDNGDGTFTLWVPVTPMPTATLWSNSLQWATPDPRWTP